MEGPLGFRSHTPLTFCLEIDLARRNEKSLMANLARTQLVYAFWPCGEHPLTDAVSAFVPTQLPIIICGWP